MNNSLLDGVLSPFLQALITGILSGLALGIALSLASVEQPAQYGLLAGVLAALVSWLSYRGAWRELLERVLIPEQYAPIEQLPLPPTKPIEPVRVIVSERDGREVSFIDLPARDEQLKALASGLLAGRSFSLTAWTGAGAVFSRNEYEQVVSELLKRGLCSWRNPHAHAQGLELSPAGRAVMRRLSE